MPAALAESHTVMPSESHFSSLNNLDLDSIKESGDQRLIR